MVVVNDTDDMGVRITVTGDIDLHTADDLAHRVIGRVDNGVDGGTLTLTSPECPTAIPWESPPCCGSVRPVGRPAAALS